MAARGFYSAQEGHHVQIFPPKDITGGVTGQAFSMAKYAHATIRLDIGASAAAFTKIILNVCTDAAGNNAVAIPFNIFKQETTDGDVLGAKTAVTAAGYTPSANDRIFYVIEIDAADLPAYDTASPQLPPYLQLQITNGVNSVIAAASALLSGSRYASDQSATVIT